MSADTKRIEELERALRIVEKERDELAADVERLCLQSGSSMFDPSYLLSERMRSAESEAHQLRLRVGTFEAERDTILEELKQARTSKLSSERSLAELSTRCATLEQDVAFYEERAAQAITARDGYLEGLRTVAIQAETQLRDLTSALEHSRSALEQSQTLNQELRSQVNELQTELARVQQQEAAVRNVAQAHAELEAKQLRDAVHQLEEGAAKLRVQLSEVQADAEHTHKLLKQAHKIEDQLSGQVKELQAALAEARRQTSGGGGQASPGGGYPMPASHRGGRQPSQEPSPTKTFQPAPRASSTGQSPGLSPRGTSGGGASSWHATTTTDDTAAAAAARALSVATTAAVTVTSAEAAAAADGASSGPVELQGIGAAAAKPGAADREVSAAAEGRRPGLPGGDSEADAAAAGAPAAAGSTSEATPGVEPGLPEDEAADSDLRRLATAAAPAAADHSKAADGEAGAAAAAETAQTAAAEARTAIDIATASADVATTAASSPGGGVAELLAAVQAAQEELQRERAVHQEEREQLEVLRVMVRDFKIKLAQATQEKVEALMKAAQLTADAQQQQPQHGGPVGQPIQRQNSTSQQQHAHQRGDAMSRRSSKDMSRSPGGSVSLYPAVSAPSPGGPPASRGLWSSWLTGTISTSWQGTAASTTGTPASAGASGATAAATAGTGAVHSSGAGSTYDASVMSDEGSEATDVSGGAAALAPPGSAAASAAAEAAAAAATVEAAEGRNRRLAVQLERLRAQLAAIDRLAGHVGRCLVQLRTCASLLWSTREADAPRRWTAMGDLTRLAEECATLWAEAGLPPAAAAAGHPTTAAHPAAAHPPVHAAGVGNGGARSHSHKCAGGAGAGAGGGGSAGSEGDDSSVVCTRESGGVQRRVAEVLLGTIDFGVKSMEQYSHHSALSSVLYS